MSDKISALPLLAAASITNADLIPIVSAGQTSRVPVSDLRAALAGVAYVPTAAGELGVVASQYEIGDVRRYGAAGDFPTTDDTAAINAAIAACSLTGAKLKAPARTYKIVPATAAVDAGGATTVGLTLKSGLHIDVEPGTVFKIADNQSTDAAPKSLYLFFTSVPLTDVSFRGLTMDMNGANNKISPSRAAGTYDTTKNMGHIGVAGDAGRIDDVVIEQCRFINTPGTNCIIAGHSNTAGITLGKRWTVRHNVFKGNGTDTSDHSAVYGWTDTMHIHNNLFIEDNPYANGGGFIKTGAQTAHEVHGANHSVHDNIVINYMRGFYLANNYTSTVYNADIHDNIMVCTYGGVAVFRAGGSAGAVKDSKIHDNVLTLIEQPFTGAPGSQIGFDVTPLLAVSEIQVYNNHVTKPGANTIPAIHTLVQPTAAAVRYDNVFVNNNSGVNLSSGIQFRTNGTNGGLGFCEARDNEFVNILTVGSQTGIGIYVDATNTIKTLILEGNKFIDEKGVPAFPLGIYLNAGTITDLITRGNVYKGLTSTRYTETGGIVVTNRNGTAHAAGDYALAGWGTTPSVSAVSARDGGGRVSVTCGTTPSANPTVTLTFKDHPWAVAPMVSQSRGEIGAPTTAEWRLTSISATAATWTFLGTPVAATVYILDFLVSEK